MDARDLVDHVPQEVSAPHTVVYAPKDGADHIPSVVTVRAGELAQICEEPGSARAVWPSGFILIDEGKQFISGDALGVGRPVTPAIRRLDGRTESLTRKHGFLLALCLQIVKKLQKHDPGQ